jgi:hypothetical protein
MGCHARGFIPKADQLLPSVQSSETGFTARERRVVERLHPEPPTLNAIFELDDARFVAALEALGVAADAQEPITAVALKYEQPLDLQAAATELAVPAHVMFRAVDESLSPLRLGGTVKRDAFTAAFPTLVRRLWLGRPSSVAVPAAHAAECGLQGGSLEARLEECALAFPDSARRGPFRLVSRTAQGKEVWRDDARQLLWAGLAAPTSQSLAVQQCSGEEAVEGLWFLPSAQQLEEALADGLPGAGWQPLWSRDVDQRHKYDAPGVAVGLSGRVAEPPGASLPSRCVARL